MQGAFKPISSNNGSYQVYALIDPRDRTIRYVGISKDARSRLAQHMSEVENRKRIWLFDLKQQGLQPDLEILETVSSDQDVIPLALEREKYWIQSFLNAGAQLTNVMGNPQAKHSGKSVQEEIDLEDDEETLTAREACEYLGISRSTLERYAVEGRITKYRRGDKQSVYFKRSNLDQLLEIYPDSR